MLEAERYTTLKRIISKCGLRISNRLSYYAKPSNLRKKATIYHSAQSKKLRLKSNPVMNVSQTTASPAAQNAV